MSLPPLVQVGNLETVLQTLNARLEEQDRKIASLETELALAPKTSQVFALQEQLEKTVAAVESRFSKLDSQVQAILPKVDRIADLSRNLDEQNDEIKLKVNRFDFQKESKSLQESLAAHRDDLSRMKADASLVEKLEESQRCTAKNVASLEGLVACKLDKVELPFIETAAQRLQELAESRDSIENCLEALDSKLESVAATLNEKEDKQMNVQRMQAIHKQLLAKADVAVVEEHAIGAINTLRDQLDHLSHTIEKACQHHGGSKENRSSSKKTKRTTSLADRFHTVEGGVSTVESECAQLKKSLAELQKQMKDKACSKSLDSKCDKGDCEQRSAETLKKLEDASVKSKAWQNVSQKHLQQLENDTQRARKQLAVVLKFIDWFSDVKLRGATNPRVSLS